MSEAVNITESEIVLFAEFIEPEIWCIVIHRFTIPLNEQPVVINPFGAKSHSFSVLLLLVCFKHIDDKLWKLQRA